MQGVTHLQLGELHEVGDSQGLLQGLVVAGAVAQDLHVLPELLTQRGDLRERLLQSGPVAGHAAVVPHQLAELAVVVVDRVRALHREQLVGAGLAVGHGRGERLVAGLERRGAQQARQVPRHGLGGDEVAVGQALHERRGTEAVGAVVAEVGLAQGEEARDGRLQVVVHPQPAHRVVGRRVDAHRDLVGVLARDALVHVEQVPVARPDGVDAEALDGGREVQVHAVLQRTDAAPLVDDGLRVARRDVTWHQVAERRVLALQEVVALRLGDITGGPGVVEVDGSPDATVVAQRLRHQRQLRLELVGRRDAGGVDLGVAGVGERSALLVRPPGGRDVAGLGVGRQEVDVAVAAGAQQHGVGRVGAHLAGQQVPGDDALGAAVVHHDVLDVHAVVELHGAEVDLARHRLVGAEQQLLAGLAPGVEGARHLGTAEGAVVEQPAVLPGEGHALGGGLVDDVDRDLGQAVHVALTCAVVAALHGVVEEAVDAVAVVLVVLRRVDAALGRDRVRPAGGVVVREDLHVVPGLAEAGGHAGAGEARAHDDDVELAAVGGVDQLQVELVVVPLVGDRAGGDLRVERQGHGGSSSQWTMPTSTAIGKKQLMPATVTAKPAAKRRRAAL